jgi:predicted permease
VALILLLLAASANMANLLLAHAAERHREIGVRLALGAGRARVARQLLTEGLCLGSLGAGVGLVTALWLGPTCAELLGIPVGIDVTFDARVYAFLVLSTLGVAGLAALAPVRYGLRGDLASPVKGATTAQRPAGSAARAVLVAVQAAVSVVLLIGTSVLAKSAVNAAVVALGFDVDHLLAVSPRYQDRSCDDTCAGKYLEAVRTRLQTLPEVEAAAITSEPPMIGAWFPLVIERDGRQHVFGRVHASADYFAVMGLRLVRGRTYTEAEAAIGAPVALVTEQFARTAWPAGDPVGARLDDVGEELAGVRVIGVVSDSVGALVPRIRQDGVFVPLTDPRAGTVMVRTRGPAEAAVPLVHAAAAALDPRVRIVTVAMKTAVADEMRPVHAVVTIASMISTVALGLALAGLYGVTAFVVSQRTQEVGIRMALGARARDVAGLLARESLRPVAIGLATGLGLAILAGKLFMSLIFGVSSTDPASLAAAAGALALSAFAAVAVPARRAARVDPAAVLRQL